MAKDGTGVSRSRSHRVHGYSAGAMWETLETSDAVEAASVDLFGAPLAPRPRVSHITALWEPSPGSTLRTIKIDKHSPKDDRDWLALQLSRARTDAIVITGKILRDEPTLAYDVPRLKRWGQGLLSWRRERWGLTEAPWLLVLTSGKGIDYAHPAFHSWVRPLVFTSNRSAARRLADSPVPVVADDEPSIVRAIEHLQREREARCISIEAGPTTSQALYGDRALPDEVLLSVYAGALEAANQGEPLWTLDELRARFVIETSGAASDARWRFQRFTSATA